MSGENADAKVEEAPEPGPDVVVPGEGEEEKVEHNKDLNADRSMIMQSASGMNREKWGNKTQFLMSCIASAVGLGNVWRFPAICAQNGGAAFLIPYFVVLFVIARPLFVLELSLGQFSSKGSVRAWELSPIFTGIGYCGMASSVLLSTFYIMLMAWALIYLVLSVVSMIHGPMVWGNETGPFFGGEVLQAVDFNSPANMDMVTWRPICHLVLALMLAWILVWVTMVNGVESSGKVAYVTALAPYVVLVILLVVGCCLDGAKIGIEFFLWKFEVAKLIDGNTWYQAVGQCFFSLGIGFGSLIMFSSFNEFHHDIMGDVLVISIVDSLTSVLAGFSLMSILGFSATQNYNRLFGAYEDKTDPDSFLQLRSECGLNGSDIESEDFAHMMKHCYLKKIVGSTGGAGLAFVQYPAAMTEINNKWGSHLGGFLGVLFFFMLILLAVGSANGLVGTTVTILNDMRPHWKRSNIVSGVCLVSCLLGMIYTNRLGAEWFDVVDQHGVTAVVYVLSFLEVVAVMWVYGMKNFLDDIKFMRNGKPIGWYLKSTWGLLPYLLITIYVVFLATYHPGRTWTWPIIIIGWSMTALCLMIIPGVAICKFFEFKRNPWRRNIPNEFVPIAKAIVKPSPRWGPRDILLRGEWKTFKSQQEPSYNIIGRLMSLFTRKQLAPVAPSISYATQAFPNMSSESQAPPTEPETPQVDSLESQAAPEEGGELDVSK